MVSVRINDTNRVISKKKIREFSKSPQDSKKRVINIMVNLLYSSIRKVYEKVSKSPEWLYEPK